MAVTVPVVVAARPPVQTSSIGMVSVTLTAAKAHRLVLADVFFLQKHFLHRSLLTIECLQKNAPRAKMRI